MPDMNGEKRMIKDKRIVFAIYVVLFVVFWNVADLLLGTITGRGQYPCG